MSEFEDKLNAILGNQEAMGQIMALAQSLGGGGKPQPEPEQGPVPEQDYVPVEPAAAQSSPPPALPPSRPGEGKQDVPPLSALGSLDPKLVQMGMRILQEYNREDDRNAALLAALRPFVKEERYAKMDRAIQIARLSRVIRVLFDALKENGGSFHV